MLIKNARILSFDENNTIIENGFVLIHDGIIEKVGDGSKLSEDNFNELVESNEQVIDANGKIVMPGFICTHTHIYSAFARGMDLKGGKTSNFIEILENLWWRLDRKLTHEDIYFSALTTAIDCIKNGVTCIFDHHAGANSIDGSLDVIQEALTKCGLRGVLCYEVSDRDGSEVMKKGINENVRFIKKCKNDDNSLINGVFGLHASFTLSDSSLQLASDEGNTLNSGFHIHVAEGRADMDDCMNKYKCGVVQRLDKFKIINDKSILAHCIHILPEEKEILKKTIVVHNPESNMNNATGYCDAEDMLNSGILVGLGSDGFSANPFRAMDACYVLHKHEKRNPSAMMPNKVIRMAINNNGEIASKYYKMPVGKVQQGFCADLIIVDYHSPTTVTKENLCGHIIFGMNSNLITDTIINGKFVMKDRIIVNLDEKEVSHTSEIVSRKLWERF